MRFMVILLLTLYKINFLRKKLAYIKNFFILQYYILIRVHT
jgi:hypothetical protein